MLNVLPTFKHVTPQDEAAFAWYYAAFCETHKNPRFYMSTLWLGTKNEFVWGEVDGCLVVVKRKVFYSNVVMHLVLPPIHRTGNLGAERGVLRAFYRAGVGALLTAEDVDRYGVGKRVKKDEGNAEYIYRAADYLDLSGKQNRNWRLQRNALDKYCKIQEYVDTMRPAIPGINTIDTEWKKRRKINLAHSNRMLEEFCNFKHCWGYTVSMEGAKIAWGIGQKVSPAPWAIMLAGHHSFTDSVIDAGRAQHIIEAQYWHEALGAEALFNTGAAIGIKGLITAKDKLRPTHVEQIYKLMPEKKLTLEDYHKTASKQKNGFAL